MFISLKLCDVVISWERLIPREIFFRVATVALLAYIGDISGEIFF